MPTKNNTNCPKCGSPLVKKNGKFGAFLACPKFPGCKYTEKLIAKTEIIKPVETKIYAHTQEQIDFFDALRASDDNIFLEAFAGCGKSTTIAESVKFVTGKVVLLTFGKIASQDLEAKVKPNNENASVSTIHSLAFKVQKALNPKMSVDTDKYKKIIEQCGLIPQDEKKSVTGSIVKIIGLLQANLFDVNEKNIKKILENYSIELEYSTRLFEIIRWVWDKGIEYNNAGIFSFDDLIFQSAKNGLKNNFDILYIDECQDLSPLNIAFIRGIAKRVIFVGDRYQSIYGFRGADVNSAENLINAFTPKILPLSTTFRCPKAIIEQVNNAFPEIGIVSKKEGGVFGKLSESKLIESILTKKSCFVLCAYNAPLVKHVYSLLRIGKKAIVRGKDIGSELVNFVLMIERKYNVSSIRELIESMDKYFNGMVEKYGENANFLDTLKDKIETLQAICENTNSVNGVIAELNKIFDDSLDNEYIFSTIHRSKGLEHNTVYILKPELIYKKATNENQKRQARNLHYVAMTRSKDELYIVE